jgi:hypothetical protein
MKRQDRNRKKFPILKETRKLFLSDLKTGFYEINLLVELFGFKFTESSKEENE